MRGSTKLKAEAAADVEAMKDHTQQMVDSIFSFGELGFQETETHRYVVDILKKNGFTVQEGVAGIPTAFMATLGFGQAGHRARQRHRRHPAGVAEAGRRVSRSADRGRAGHGEGHNSGVPLNITAAIAVKKIMEREKLPGTIRIWPGTAEELVGTKAYFIRAGLFKDVDVALFTHVGNDLRRLVGGSRTAPGWCRSSIPFAARRRMPPARRGAAAARSTPSS